MSPNALLVLASLGSLLAIALGVALVFWSARKVRRFES